MLSPSRAQLLSGLHSFTQQDRFVHFRAGPRWLPTSAWHPQSRPYEGNFLLAVWARVWQRRVRVRDTPGLTELLKLGFSPGLSLVSHQTEADYPASSGPC